MLKVTECSKDWEYYINRSERKINQLVDENDDLRKAYHAEMNALNGFVNELSERIKKLEEKDA